MAGKHLLLVKDKTKGEKGKVIDMRGRSKGEKNFNRPYPFKTTRQADSFIKALTSRLENKSEDDFEMILIEHTKYFKKYFPEHDIDNAKSLMQ